MQQNKNVPTDIPSIPQAELAPAEEQSRSLPQRLAVAALLSTTLLAACELQNPNDSQPSHVTTSTKPSATATHVEEGQALAAPVLPPLGNPSHAPASMDMAATLKRITHHAVLKGGTGVAEVPLLTVSRSNERFVVGTMGKHLTLKQLKPLEKAVQDNALWLNTAMDSGTVDSVIFTVDDSKTYGYPDGNPQFFPPVDTPKGDQAGYIAYPLPSKGKINTNALTDMLHHEIDHALVDRLSFVGRGNKDIVPGGKELKANLNQYAHLCSSIRNTAVTQAAEYVSPQLEPMLDTLAGQMDPRGAAFIKQVATSLEDGTFAKFQPSQNESLGDWESVVQACQVDDPWRVIYRYFDAHHLKLPNFMKQEKTADNVDSIIDTWRDSIKNHSLYTPLRENTYFKPGEVHEDGMGHPYDNANEFVASLVNVATRHTDAFIANMQTVPAAQRHTVYDLLQLAAHDMVRANPNEPAFTNKLELAIAQVEASR